MQNFSYQAVWFWFDVDDVDDVDDDDNYDVDDDDDDNDDDDDDDDGNDENGNEGFVNKSDLVVQPFFARTFLEGKGV